MFSEGENERFVKILRHEKVETIFPTGLQEDLIHVSVGWMREVEYQDHLITADLAESGYLRELKLLVEMGCELHPDIISAPARGGQLNIIEYLEGVKGISTLESAAVYHAVKRGHFEVVKYLVFGGYRTEYAYIGFARRGGHEEIAGWLTWYLSQWN